MIKLCIASFFIILVIALNTSVAEEIAIIVNKDNGIEGVSLADLKKIFKAERTFWGKGSKIQLIMRPRDSIETKVLLENIYEIPLEEFTAFWLKLVYSGKVDRVPPTINSASIVNVLVSQTKGAVAPIEVGRISKLAKVKILKIDGKMPNDEGYPLKTRE